MTKFIRHNQEREDPDNIAGQMLTEALSALTYVQKAGTVNGSDAYAKLQMLLQVYVYTPEHAPRAVSISVPTRAPSHSWSKAIPADQIKRAFVAMIRNMTRRDALVRLSERYGLTTAQLASIVDNEN